MVVSNNSVGSEVLNDVDYASLVDVRAWVRLVTNNEEILLLVVKLPARAGALQHDIAQMLEH